MTPRQQRSFHKLCQLVAETLNEAGLDQRKVLKPGIDIPWTKESVKEQLWKPVQSVYLHKDSTTDLTTQEINQMFDVINRHLSEKHGVSMPPFPSIEEIINNQRNYE